MRRTRKGKAGWLGRRLAIGALAGCVAGSSGCVYVNVTTPLDDDMDETELGSRVGKAHAQSVLGLVAWGDAGTRAAAEEGGVETIRHADQNIFSILGFVYTRITTIVYGD